MDFLTDKEKKQRSRKLFLMYGLLGILVSLGTAFLVLQAFGFDIDRKSGQVVQNGLIFIDAKPTRAEIIVNGKSEGSTDARLALPQDTYNVTLKSEGYRDWNRTINLLGGSVEYLIYPRLFPESILTSEVTSYNQSLQFVTQSPDRRWLVVAKSIAALTVDIYDLSKEAPSKTELAFDPSLFAEDPNQQAGKVSVIEWSNDNRHVLVSYKVEGLATQFIVLDREAPERSININRVLAINADQVSLRDKRYDKLYLLQSGVLRSADLVTLTMSAPIAEDVLTYKGHGSELLTFVVRNKEQPDIASVKIRSKEKNYTLADYTYKDGTVFKVDAAEFSDDWYYIITSSTEHIAKIFKNPLNSLAAKNPTKALPFASIQISGGTLIGFSANTRFVAVQKLGEFGVYDFETKNYHQYTLEDEVAENENAYWMDGHRFVLLRSGRVEIFDFDGSNQQDIIGSAKGYKVFFDRDYKRLLSVAPSVVEGRQVLQLSDLIVK